MNSVDPPIKERLRRAGIVAVLRAEDATRFVTVALKLVEIGVRAIEVTLTARGALDAIAAIRNATPQGVAVGAGTVLTEIHAAACVEAGADFLVTPALAPDIIRLGLSTSTPVFPGVLTPTELLAARETGVDLVKLFPAAVMGPGYLRDLHGPFPDIDVMPTGGIAIDQIEAWLQTGATAVGVGGPLLGDALTGGSLEALNRRTQKALAAVRSARGGTR
jgi:2-dehydro-3-deoxyphosphogluconate aldolase/(4S)-4-hydroxy-2-oxoglutarate aldolase